MTRRAIAAILLFLAGLGLALAAEVVVLKGGSRIELKGPPVRQGNNVLVTRADGTLFSVPASEIDWKATAAARSAPVSKPAPLVSLPPETPAEAARQAREGPKARVKITDADVNHVAEPPGAAAEAAKKDSETKAGGARIEIVDYTQEKAGANLVVRGTARNVGQASALSLRMTVTVLDDKQQKINSADASLANGTLDAGSTVAFTATIPIGENVPASLRFAPHWIAPVPPAPAGTAPAAGAGMAGSGTAAPGGNGSAPRPNAAPTPVPTPYGRGLLYAAPAPPAPNAPPADGKSGYIPGATRKEDQPKLPE